MTNFNRRAWARLGAATVALVAAGAMVGLAGPAYAEGPAADLSIDLSGERIARFAGKVFYVDIHNAGPDKAEDVKFSVDVSDIDFSRLVVIPPPGCDIEDATFTCLVGDVDAGGNDGLTAGLIVVSVGEKKPGPAGSVKLKVWSSTTDPNAANDTKTVDIEVQRRGLDLVTRTFDVYQNLDRDRVEPGKTGLLDMFFENASTLFCASETRPCKAPLAIKGLEYTINLPKYTTFAEHIPECSYSNGDRTAECSLPDLIIDPGLGYEPATFEVKLALNAPGPIALTDGVVSGRGITTIRPEDAPPPEESLKRSSARGTVKPKPDRDPKDNDAKFSVFTAANPADLAVAATSASGTVGSEVTLTISGENKGPGGAIDAFFTVKAPSGTQIPAQELTSECDEVVAGKEYRCADTGGTVTDAGDSFSVDVKFKILSATVGSEGTTTVGSKSADPDTTNNSAPLKITVSGSAGGLPVTGMQVGVIGVVGVAVVALGGVLLMLSRRRRVVIVAPGDEASTE